MIQKKPGEKLKEEIIKSDEFIATTWVHIDSRDFSAGYQKDEFYCKSETTLKKTSFIECKLVETSDSGKYKEIMNCNCKAEEKEVRERKETLWRGIIKDAYVLEFKNGNADTDKKWSVKCSSKFKRWISGKGYDKNNSDHVDAVNNLSKPRIQEVVLILAETATQYKIKPRTHSNEGWIDKKYIKQICKHEKSE